MSRSILVFAASFLCAGILFGSNLQEACSQGIDSQKSRLESSKFVKDLKDKTLSAKYFLQMLVNDELIYGALEHQIMESTHPYQIAIPGMFRKKVLSEDIQYLSSHFNIPVPYPTSAAIHFATTFSNYSPRGLKVAYYILYTELLPGSEMRTDMNAWLDHNGIVKNVKFLRFKFGYACIDEVVKNLKDSYKSIPLNNDKFPDFKDLAGVLKKQLIGSYESVYSQSNHGILEEKLSTSEILALMFSDQPKL